MKLLQEWLESAPRKDGRNEAITVHGLNAGACASREHIIGILHEQGAGVSVANLCRTHGLRAPTFYKGKARFGDMDVSAARRLKALKTRTPS